MSKISYDEAVKQGLTKECTECHKVKSVAEFSRQKKGKYGADSKCKECMAQYYQNNKEEIAKRHKRYYQNNKEERANYLREYRQTSQGKENQRKGRQKYKTLKKQSFYQLFTQEDKEFCLNYFNYKCPYTGKPLINSEIHTDHIVALSDKNGIGATAPWNMLLCDASANHCKSNKPVLEFINSLPNSDEIYNKIRGYIILQAKRYIDILPEDDVTLKTFNITFEELED